MKYGDPSPDRPSDVAAHYQHSSMSAGQTDRDALRLTRSGTEAIDRPSAGHLFHASQGGDHPGTFECILADEEPNIDYLDTPAGAIEAR